MHGGKERTGFDVCRFDMLNIAKKAVGHLLSWQILACQLRLGKRPMRWCYRPVAWPVWNHEHRRLVRFWSAAEGLDTAVIDALGSRRLDHLQVVEPSIDDIAQQLREELVVSRRHLRTVLDHYWDRDWRRERKGYDESSEDHLWRAATAVTEICDALDNIGG